MTTFELVPQGPFSLTASAAFLEGFSPAAHRAADAGHLHLAFVPDGEEAAAGVCLRQPDGVVVGEVFGKADPEVVPEQVARILSLDVDGTGFAEVGERDPVVGDLQRRLGFAPPATVLAAALREFFPGRIAVALQPNGLTFAFKVSDNGIGLPSEQRHRLTEPYVTTRAKGTGLGLAIVRKIMEDHGGLLLLDDREGGGARISLVFRRDAREIASVQSHATAAQ